MKVQRFCLLVIVVAVAISGCLSTSTPIVAPNVREEITLVAHSQLFADGPEVQELRLRAVSSSGRLVSFANLLLFGITPDGTSIPVEPVELVLPVQPASTDSESASEAVVVLNVRELVEQGVSELEVVLGSALLVIELVTGRDGFEANTNPEANVNGEPDPALEPEAEPAAASEPELEPALEPELEVERESKLELEPEPDLQPVPELELEPELISEPFSELEPVVEPAATSRQTVEIRTLRRGTSQATNAYIIRSLNPGPTVMIVAGVHGDERSGPIAAREIARTWTIDAGTLVVLPEANKLALQRNRRTAADGIDLNRQFPLNRTPTTALAREIWNLVREFRPVALLDMHEGWGIWGIHDSVGQTLLVYNARDARAFANAVVRYMNTYHVNNTRTYRFRVTGPPIAGSLARKAGAELRIPAFIAEATAYRTTLASRVRWHKVFAEELLRWYGLIKRSERIVPKAYRASAHVPGLGSSGIETPGIGSGMAAA